MGSYSNVSNPAFLTFVSELYLDLTMQVAPAVSCAKKAPILYHGTLPNAAFGLAPHRVDRGLGRLAPSSEAGGGSSHSQAAVCTVGGRCRYLTPELALGPPAMVLRPMFVVECGEIPYWSFCVYRVSAFLAQGCVLQVDHT